VMWRLNTLHSMGFLAECRSGTRVYKTDVDKVIDTRHDHVPFCGFNVLEAAEHYVSLLAAGFRRAATGPSRGMERHVGAASGPSACSDMWLNGQDWSQVLGVIADNCSMRWRNPMPRFDFFKERPLVKLAALALVLTPAILLAIAAVLRALR
jgi:hypothetical protein